MSISKDQARLLTPLALACRPVGAPKWDEAGTFAAIGRIASWPLPMAIEHVVRHAADSKARTPGVIGSSHTPAELGSPTGGPHRKTDDCSAHPGMRAESCPWCVGGVRAWDEGGDDGPRFDDPRAVAKAAARGGPMPAPPLPAPLPNPVDPGTRGPTP